MCKEEKKTYYTLFIDECGDPNLEKFDKTFPLFTLCGVLVPQNEIKMVGVRDKILEERALEHRRYNLSFQRNTKS